MVTFTTVFLAATAFTGALNIPGGNSMRRASIGSSTGTNNGLYDQFWSNGVSTVHDSNGGKVIAGKVRNPSSTSRTNHFSGSYNPGSSGGSLALYDWSENPLVNYYGTNGGGGWSKNPLASSYGTNGGGGWSKNPLANSYGTNGGGGWSKTPLVEYYGTTRGGGWSRW